MKIQFSTYYDGVDWSTEGSALGYQRLGPAGLQSLLAVRLGLSAPEPNRALRIAQYQNRLAALDHPDGYYHAS
ncbi:MAG: hypothetical protein KDK33_20695, partial [Leptospiraceae bacterium]|nr:hypothetical protein [Leptospiraceae bacterium]